MYVHKIGAPHVIDPSKLLRSAQRLWPKELQRLFGETLPVPVENLRILEGGESLKLGSRQFERFLVACRLAETITHSYPFGNPQIQIGREPL